MSSLAVSLNTIGISRAQGVELVAQREQIDATLPRGGGDAKKPAEEPARAAASRELTPEELRIVAELQQIDRAVRAHEQAHLQAGHGVVTSGANYTYTYGPDGRQYAVGGEVGIDTSAEPKPEANIDKGIRIQAAALAPIDPSQQDYSVATVGSRLEAQGRSDLTTQQAEMRAREAERNAQAREEALRQAYASSGTTPETTAPGDTVSVFA